MSVEGITWKEFYDRFYEWSPSTQKSYSYRLMDYGPAEQVFEIIEDFISEDESFADRFINKAVNTGVRFSAEQIIDLISFLPQSTITRLAENCSHPLSRDDLEELYSFIDDDAFKRLSHKAGIDIFEDEDEDEDDIDVGVPIKDPKRLRKGLLTTLFVGGFLASKDQKSKHKGKCNGDCAHCPPHYGYRYGRWYYGHSHQYGCEFGGNSGDGRA